MISLSILLVGCNVGNKKSDSNKWVDSLENVQKIEVISSEQSDPISTITDNQDVADFIRALKLDEWEVKEVPSKANKGNQFEMYQQETIKLGESSEDKKALKQVASITAYTDTPYIDLNLKSLTFSFKIPDDVFMYLSEYK